MFNNYRTGEKAQVFSFPKDEVLRTKWLRAIPRKDFAPTENNKVRNILLHCASIVSLKWKRDYSFLVERAPYVGRISVSLHAGVRAALR